MRHPMLLLPLLALACSQAPAPSGSTTLTVAAPPAGVAAAGGASAASTPPPGMDERDFAVPSEKFSDAQRNFEAAKRALLDGYYSGGLTEDDLYRAAVAGMVERVDPQMHKWNRLLSPTDLADLHSDLQGEIVGVGIVIGFDVASGYIDVKGTVAGSPAERAGLAPPDKIVTVDGKLFRGLAMRDVVHQIRGKSGETVTLSVLRGDKLVSIPLVREKVAFDVVRADMIGQTTGYVRIPAFNSKTPAALHDVLADLASRGARALVVDVRNNQGGTFDDAVASVGEMVPAGSTVVNLNRRGKVEPVVAKTTPLLLDVPVAVLVDKETASSAELVAAALHDLRHATLVGTRTHGKWTVQKVEDLPNGYALKYTSALFTSPAGKSFEGAGLAPDVEVDEASEAIEHALLEKDPAKRVEEDVQIRTALAVLAAR
jgi:carboxyl-terminal processing protease